MHLPYCYFNLFGDGTVVLVCLEYLKNSDIMPNLKKKKKNKERFPYFLTFTVLFTVSLR